MPRSSRIILRHRWYVLICRTCAHTRYVKGDVLPADLHSVVCKNCHARDISIVGPRGFRWSNASDPPAIPAKPCLL